jgi:hypothetical protein
MADHVIQSTLDDWRAQGHDRVDAMRFRTMEALARRAALNEGGTRRVLDARLTEKLDAYARDIEVSGAHEAAPHAQAMRGPLAALLDELNERAGSHQAPAELIDYLRAVWSKVSAEKRVRESLAHVPKNAGPLNSNNLVHRSLSLMREVSPEYLQHFLGYLDALSWMEELTVATSPATKEAPRATAAKKPARAKRAS